jgi:hypothetical protein
LIPAQPGPYNQNVHRAAGVIGFGERDMPLKIAATPKPRGPSDARPLGSAAAATQSHDVAAYIEDIAGELEVLALGAKLDLLAYFLRLAQLEARSAGGGAAA